MEWLRKDSLLQKEDLNVLKFLQMSSTVLSFESSCSPVFQSVQTDEDWNRWLEQQEERGGAAQSKLTLMLGGRKKSRIEGDEPSYLPFSGPKILCDKIVPVMQIHRSIARVINRNTTATFSVIETKHSIHGRPLLVYNCRSSSEWPGDMALTVTYSPEKKSTHAVVFGCTNIARKIFSDRLSICDFLVYHPLTVPTMFAEFERDRHFGLVDPLISKLVEKAVKIAKPHNSSMKSSRSDPAGLERPGTITNNPDDLMELWLKVSYLKRGLETWKQQLEKMISHCKELTQDGLHISDRSFDDSAGSTPVNAILSIDVPTKTGGTDVQFDEFKDLEQSGRRIRQRLLELKCEYDEKIRNCNTIVEGMILAAQLEWNKIGQIDAQTNLDISKYNLDIATSTGYDSKQMRSIAVLTMIFLPATFVASLFSMSFFDLGPEAGNGKVSSWIWLYFVVTAGFTGVTVSVWYFWTNIRPNMVRKPARNDV